MEVLVLLGLPVFMAAVVFVLKRDLVGKCIFLLMSFTHLFTVIGLWQRPCDISFNPFLGFDALSRLVLSVISSLFLIFTKLAFF